MHTYMPRMCVCIYIYIYIHICLACVLHVCMYCTKARCMRSCSNITKTIEVWLTHTHTHISYIRTHTRAYIPTLEHTHNIFERLNTASIALYSMTFANLDAYIYTQTYDLLERLDTSRIVINLHAYIYSQTYMHTYAHKHKTYLRDLTLPALW
jgi:hypothetical protein